MEKTKFYQYKDYFLFLIEEHLKKEKVSIAEMDFLENDLRKFVNNFDDSKNKDKSFKQSSNILNFNIKLYEKEFLEKLKKESIYMCVFPFFMKLYRMLKRDSECSFLKEKLRLVKNEIEVIEYS